MSDSKMDPRHKSLEWALLCPLFPRWQLLDPDPSANSIMIGPATGNGSLAAFVEFLFGIDG